MIITVPSGYPVDLSAVNVTSTNVTLTWGEINCLDRKGVITSYLIRYGVIHATLQTLDTQSNSTTYTFSDLNMHIRYRFSIAGANKISGGPFSDYIIVQTSKHYSMIFTTNLNLSLISFIVDLIFKTIIIFRRYLLYLILR